MDIVIVNRFDQRVVTDLINVLPGNSSVNSPTHTYTQATIRYVFYVVRVATIDFIARKRRGKHSFSTVHQKRRFLCVRSLYKESL
jgi:hypothetical protein